MKRNGHNGEGLPGSLEAFMLSHLRMPPVQDYPRPEGAPEPIRVPSADNIIPQVSAESSAGIPRETSLTELVRLMIERGCSPEMILMATALYEKNSKGIPRNSAGTTQENKDFARAERRREKDRERKRLAKLSRGIPRNGDSEVSIRDKKDTIDKKESKEVRGSGIRARVEYPADFESFWKSYPRTPTMGKAETFAVWKKIPAEERQLAAAAVPKFVAWLKTQKPDYPVIHACRFLSKKRFDGFQAMEATRENTKIPPWERDGITKDEWLKQKGITNGASRG